MDLRSRLVEQFGLSPKFARAGDAALREKMEIIKKLGTTGEEMHAAAEAADRLDKVLEEGRASLDKWLTLVGTTITEVLLYINKVMDKIRDTFNFSKLKQLGIILAPFTGGTSAAASNLLEWYNTFETPRCAEICGRRSDYKADNGDGRGKGAGIYYTVRAGRPCDQADSYAARSTWP